MMLGQFAQILLGKVIHEKLKWMFHANTEVIMSSFAVTQEEMEGTEFVIHPDSAPAESIPSP